MTAVRKNRVASLGAAVVLVTGLTALGSPAWAQPNTPLAVDPPTLFGQTVNAVTMASRDPRTGAMDFFWNNNDGAGGWGKSRVSVSVSSEPAIAVGQGSTRIAAAGPGDSLDFYWNVNGTSTWNKMTVSGAGTAVGGPAMIHKTDASLIVARHSDNSLWFTYNNDRTSGWPTSRIDGPNSAFSHPAIDHSGGSTKVVVRGPNGSLVFYWNVDGSGTWNKTVVAASGVTNTDPAMATHPSSGPFPSGTQIVVRTPSDGLAFYHNNDGQNDWGSGSGSEAAVGTVFSDPSLSLTSEDHVFAWQGPDHSLLFQWGHGPDTISRVAGPGTTFTAPSVVRGLHSTIVSARDANNRVIVYRNADGSSVWTATVAG